MIPNEHLKELLISFSFSADEADIYLIALSLENPTVSEIARKSRKSRTATYFHVKKMIGRGILKESRKGKILKCIPKDPIELADLFEKHSTNFRGFVPQLQSLRKIETEQPKIEITESKRGYADVYNEVSAMPEGSIFRIVEGRVGLQEELKILTDDQWAKFFSRIIERKIITLGIFTESSLSLPVKLLTRDNFEYIKKREWCLKSLPDEIFPLKKLAIIYGNKIAFLFPEQSLVMKIEHEGITETFKALFDALFTFADPVKNVWQ